LWAMLATRNHFVLSLLESFKVRSKDTGFLRATPISTILQLYRQGLRPWFLSVDTAVVSRINAVICSIYDRYIMQTGWICA
jgi:hypothetical protein